MRPVLKSAAPLPRRKLLQVGVGAAALHAALPIRRAKAARPPAFRAIAFDAFPIFDPRPIVARAEHAFPGRGAALVEAWRVRQFEYQWLRALGGRYADFWQATEDSLIFAAKLLKLDLDGERRAHLMAGFSALRAWPDAAPALGRLRDAGVRLGFLSNFTERMLREGIESAGLAGLFEHVLSTDSVRTYKPDPRAYRLGVEAFGLAQRDILFVAFAGWDAAGAKWFGYPTFWANRLGLPAEELGATPDAGGATLAAMADLVLGG